MSTSQPVLVPPLVKDQLKTGPKVPVVVPPPPGFQKRHYPHWLFDPPGTLPVAFRKPVTRPPVNCYVNPTKPYIIRNLEVPKVGPNLKKDCSGSSNLNTVDNGKEDCDLDDDINAWGLLDIDLGSESPSKRRKS